jgi:thioesterase domain-containing protein
MKAPELEKLLKTEIPISASMGFRDLQIETDALSLTLPLRPNKNHKGTLFGGSLYAGCALACYGLFLMRLREQGVQSNDLVIANGEIKYIAPVDEDATIRARWPSLKEKEQFFKTLEIKKKARIPMTAEVSVKGKICAVFTGQFVAHLAV